MFVRLTDERHRYKLKTRVRDIIQGSPVTGALCCCCSSCVTRCRHRRRHRAAEIRQTVVTWFSRRQWHHAVTIRRPTRTDRQTFYYWTLSINTRCISFLRTAMFRGYEHINCNALSPTSVNHDLSSFYTVLRRTQSSSHIYLKWIMLEFTICKLLCFTRLLSIC